MNTIYEELKTKGFKISRKEIIGLGIDPEKEWGYIDVLELKAIADELDVKIKDLL